MDYRYYETLKSEELERIISEAELRKREIEESTPNLSIEHLGTSEAIWQRRLLNGVLNRKGILNRFFVSKRVNKMTELELKQYKTSKIAAIQEILAEDHGLLEKCEAELRFGANLDSEKIKSLKSTIVSTKSAIQQNTYTLNLLASGSPEQVNNHLFHNNDVDAVGIYRFMKNIEIYDLTIASDLPLKNYEYMQARSLADLTAKACALELEKFYAAPSNIRLKDDVSEQLLVEDIINGKPHNDVEDRFFKRSPYGDYGHMFVQLTDDRITKLDEVLQDINNRKQALLEACEPNLIIRTIKMRDSINSQYANLDNFGVWIEFFKLHEGKYETPDKISQLLESLSKVEESETKGGKELAKRELINDIRKTYKEIEDWYENTSGRLLSLIALSHYVSNPKELAMALQPKNITGRLDKAEQIVLTIANVYNERKDNLTSDILFDKQEQLENYLSEIRTMLDTNFKTETLVKYFTIDNIQNLATINDISSQSQELELYGVLEKEAAEKAQLNDAYLRGIAEDIDPEESGIRR